MAGSRIKGITIEIDGNTTKLQKALQGTNKDLKSTQQSLKDVNKLLKLDPKNVNLLKQKQDLLKKAIEDTKKKIDTEKEALQQLKNADQTPEVIAQQQALERQIAEDEAALGSLKDEAGGFQSAGLQAFFAVGEQVKAVGEKIKNVGENLTKNVTVPLAALGGATIAAFKNVDDGYDTMIKKTGATGKSAKEMKDIIDNLATSIPTSFDAAGAAVGEVNTRFGLTGNELEDLSSKFIKFAELNDTDVSNSIDKVQKALSAYGLGAEDAGAYLDRLNKTGQETGVSVDKLAEGMVTNGAAFQEMGLSIDQATVFMGQLEKSGANSETVMSGMRKALKNATKEGKPLNEALSDLQETIKNGNGSMDGLTAAYDLFGKSGDQIYAAVQNGTLDFENLGAAVSNAGGSVTDTFEATLDPLDDFQTTMNKLKITGARVGSVLLSNLAPILEKVGDIFIKIKEKWESLDPKTQDMIIKAAMIAAAVGPVITVIGTLVTAIGALMSPIGLVVLAIGAAIAAGIAIYKNWDKIKEAAQKLWKTIKDKFEGIKEAIFEAFEKAKEKVESVWNFIKEKITGVINKIKSVVEVVFLFISTFIKTQMSIIETVVTTIWNAIKTVVTTVINAIKNFISTAWNTIKTTTSTVWTAIKTAISTVWNSIKGAVNTAINSVKNTVSSVFNTVKSTVSTVWESIRSTISGKWESIKSSASTATSTISSTLSSAWSSIQSTASTMWTLIKAAITNPVDTAKTLISSAVSSIKSFMSFSGLSSSVRNTFNAIKTAITNPIDTAKGLLKSAIDTIKGFFPFNLGKICNLKLPHINVSAGSPPWGIGGKGTKPSFSVNWYAKGGIFQQPTLFTTPNGLAGVGEAGAEAVLPLSLLWKHMEEMGDNIVSGVAASNQSYSDAMYHAIVAAFGELSFSISDREFARILRGHGAI